METPGTRDLCGTALPCGIAISPEDAARCALDAPRTAAYLRGLHRALEGRALGERPLEVLYAGTGPLAPLMLPLMADLPPGAVRVTFVDVHARAVALLARLVERLGLAPSVRALAVADAARFEPAVAPDVLVVEAMQRSLAREPQVAITRHLAPRLAPGGVLLPGRVRLELALAASPDDPAAPRVSCGTLFELTRESAGAPVDLQGRFPGVIVEVPAAAARMPWPVILTHVEVIPGIAIGERESGLTTPEVLAALCRLREGERVAFCYRLGSAPGLAWERA